MRSREMHNKLDRLSELGDDGEDTCPDISLLSPEEQDRAHELLAKIEGVENEQEFLAKINENTITQAELRELSDLFAELPQLGAGDHFNGPSYEIPLELRSCFTRLLRRENEGVQPQCDCDKLKLVQKARFVGLCRKYGWEGEYPNPDRGWKHRKHRDPVRLLPLSQWDPDDEAELRSVLDVAQA
jgi:hypothetical protein